MELTCAKAGNTMSNCFISASRLARRVSEHKCKKKVFVLLPSLAFDTLKPPTLFGGRRIAFAENGQRMAGRTDWNGITAEHWTLLRC